VSGARRALRRLVVAFALAGAAVALAVALMTLASVVLRFVTGRPIQGDVELTQYGIALAVSLGIPWCQLRGANLIVDFFTQRLAAPALRRLDAVGALLIALMFAVLAWRTGAGAVAVKAAGETSMIRELPTWWVYAALAPGLALAALVALAQARGHWSGRPLGDDEHAAAGG
jgi:TRAP-type C4-dicarboxylate transport system permease small subunit